MSAGVALWSGAACVFVALLTVALSIVKPARRTVRLGPAAVPASSGGGGGLTDLARRMADAAERQLDERNARTSFDRTLEQAGIMLRPGELIVIGVTSTVATFLLVSLTVGVLLGIVLAALVPLGIRAVVLHKASERRQAFAEQLDDLLQMTAGSLRSGYGLAQAIEAASHESDAPTCDELRRVTTEVRLGRDLVDSLEAMDARIGNDEFRWVIQAIRIHREVGGDLGEVLDRVGETIRARARLHRQVRALSAEGRISSYVLTALPVVLVGVMSFTNPGYLNTLLHGVGLLMVGASAVLMTIGTLWLRKLIRPTF